MFRSSAPDSPLDSRLEEIFREISQDLFGTEEELRKLDFATIEQRAHEVGRRVAQRLTEEAAAKQAESAAEPQPCPKGAQRNNLTNFFIVSVSRCNSSRRGTCVVVVSLPRVAHR